MYTPGYPPFESGKQINCRYMMVQPILTCTFVAIHKPCRPSPNVIFFVMHMKCLCQNIQVSRDTNVHYHGPLPLDLVAPNSDRNKDTART